MLTPINYVWASSATNKSDITSQQDLNAGIVFQSEITSEYLNGALYILSKAMREQQVSGGFYINTKEYKEGNFVKCLVSVGGMIKLWYFRCMQDGTKGQPPINANSAVTKDDITIYNVEAGTWSENNTQWQRVFCWDRKLVKTNTANQKLYTFFNNNNPQGRIKVRLFNSSGVVQCSFYVDFISIQQFKISQVVYHTNIRKSNNLYSSGGYIFMPGFAIFCDKNSVFGLSIYDNRFASQIEVDYTELNFSSNFSATTFNSNNCYAVIENGGTHRQGLGEVVHSMRNNTTDANGDTYDFFCFSNGYFPWATSIVLNSNLYHQWNNGGMASVNFDASDCYLVNKGNSMGKTNGVMNSQSLPNIKGTFSTAIYTSYDTPPTGAFKDRTTKTNNYAAGSFTFTNSDWEFKASNSDTTFKDGAVVRGKCIVSTWFLKAY